MKIYHEEDESVKEVEDSTNALIAQCDDERLEIVKRLANSIAHTNALKCYEWQEKNKYKLMWNLRELEKQITDENGILVIKGNGKIEVKGFSDDLTSKIHALLDKAGY